MKLVSTWEELAKVPSSETHFLDIEKHSGWIRDKKTGEGVIYLSTHTFYGGQHLDSTLTLQKYGFNVELASWDKDPLPQELRGKE